MAKLQRAVSTCCDACKCREEPDGAAHRSDHLLRKTEVVVVGIRHRTHHKVRYTVEADGRQHHQREPAMCAEESDERSHNRVEETHENRRSVLFIDHYSRALRLFGKPGRDY